MKKLLSAACLVMLMTGCQGVQPEQQPIVSEGSPIGMRKFMEMNQMRYEFMNDGAPVEIESDTIGEKLGQLSNEIIEGNEIMKDFSTSFAVNGNVYELTNYSPSYRVAVELDGTYYIAESVGATDTTAMNLQQYLKDAQWNETVVSASIYDHQGINEIKSLNKEQALSLVQAISNVEVTQLSDESYEALANTQVNGESYLVVLTLQDNTTTHIYIVPSLNYVLIGDYIGFDSQLNENLAPLF